MKKVISVLIMLVLVISIAGCGSSSSGSDTKSAAPAAAASSASAEKSAVAEQSATAEQSVQEDSSAPAASEAEGEVDRSDWVPLNLKFNTFNTDTNVANYPLEVYFYGRLQDEMPGLVNLESFYNGTLVSQADTLDGIIDGIVDIGVVDLSAIPGRLPVLDMFNYPGVASTSADAATRVLWDFVHSEDLAELQDVHFLWGHRSGPCMILTSEHLDGVDLSGLQLRASATFAELAKALNGTVVTMPLSDVYEAIRNGMLNGAITTGPIFSYFKMYEVAGYGKQCPLVSNIALFLMNKDVYESMPESQREVFDKVVNETQEVCYNHIEQWAEYMETYYDFLNGLKELTWMEGEELAQAEAATASMVEDYAQQLNGMGLDGDHYLAKYRELAEKYNAEFPAEEAVANLEAFKNGEIPIVDIKATCEELLEEARSNY